ncbi:DJ-1/PfpI family protein [Endozoicomonas sp. SM1973]|uniref:DJ-1/PfpI family protein n=1 Tax=Spartinivicinus marinus TaxID=2994442 RepID=A0A853I7L8_9GAMM|nr:DJ-1 family glyoxalase III [Spartinivicinus marinus]MCX4028860.1 DJ-1/PfpI family protein [Spartinivicinus marinus]NYZ65557.1 DJ-1/PfpI family protein [Spartinivicinus marinus]
MKKVLVAIADGSEELEAVCIIDVLRRADVDVVVASCMPTESLLITASRGVKIQADCHIKTCVDQAYDLVVLPGGMPGAKYLYESQPLTGILEKQRNNKQWHAAICASPAVVLAQHGWLKGVKATCYPSFQDKLIGAQVDRAAAVVVDQDNKLITSQGPGTALAFALALVEVLLGKEKAQSVAQPMVIHAA